MLLVHIFIYISVSLYYRHVLYDGLFGYEYIYIYNQAVHQTKHACSTQAHMYIQMYV